MDFHHFSYSFNKSGIKEDDLFRLLRMEDVSEADHLASVVRTQLNKFEELNREAIGGYAIFDKQDLDVKNGIIKINNQSVFTGPQICGYLKESESFAVFICTAGKYITEISSEYNKSGDFLEAYISDMIGSIAVEKAMDLVQAQMESVFATRGLKISQRYSPGYCNWPLVSQRELFSILPPNDCGISLTESSLMIPIKSVSGMIGVGKNVQKREYACEVCNSPSCIYREVRMKSKY